MATPKTKRTTFTRTHKQTRHAVDLSAGGRAKQSMKDDCDINKIMAKFQRTGAITHFNRHSPKYGFATSQDFADSMRIITSAQEMFNDLPSEIRTKFHNNPGEFLEFVQNPDNASEMETLGLTTKKSESPEELPPGSSEGDPKPSAEPSESPPTG